MFWGEECLFFCFKSRFGGFGGISSVYTRFMVSKG